jgi:hypothetical protein
LTLFTPVKSSRGSPPTQISSWVWKRVFPPNFGATNDAGDASEAGKLGEVVDWLLEASKAGELVEVDMG